MRRPLDPRRSSALDQHDDRLPKRRKLSYRSHRLVRFSLGIPHPLQFYHSCSSRNTEKHFGRKKPPDLAILHI
jgi:hypothetical protein